MDTMAFRVVGRTVLYVSPVPFSDLAQGRPRAASGMRTEYAVYAGATRGRGTVKLAQCATLDQARAYVAGYRLNLGLLTRG